MSVEQRPDRQTQDPEQFHIPTHAPEYEERVDDFSERNESWFKRYRKALIATGAVATAGATLAAGLALGLKGSEGNSSSKEGQGPVATASANPGEASPSASSSEAGPKLPKAISIEIGGKTVTVQSKEELAAAYSQEFSKAPDSREASKTLIDELNSVMNYGLNEADAAAFDSYASADGQRLGVGALKEDIVIPAYLEAVTGSPANGAAVMESPENWSQWVHDTAQEVTHRWLTTRNSGVAYEFSCAINTAKPEGGMTFDSGDPASGLEHGNVFIKCTDNIDETDLGSRQLADGTQGYNSLTSKQLLHVDFQKQGDQRKLVGMQTEDLLQ